MTPSSATLSGYFFALQNMTGSYPETKRLISALLALMPSPIPDNIKSTVTNNTIGNAVLNYRRPHFRGADIARSMHGLQSIDASKSNLILLVSLIDGEYHLLRVVSRHGNARCNTESWKVS